MVTNQKMKSNWDFEELQVGCKNKYGGKVDWLIGIPPNLSANSG